MKQKILWLAMALVLIATMVPVLVLSSCTKTTTTTTTTKAANTPVYGGTFTMLNNVNTTSNSDPTGWDHIMAINLGQASVWGNPYMEKLLVGDIEKFGPRGNNTFAFNLWENVPEQYWGGLLATSWEIQTTPSIVFTFHLRQGVMFTGNTNINMAARELTATDVVYSEERAKSRPGFAAGLAWLNSEVAVDKYTVQWNVNPFYANWAWRFNGTALGQIWAKESVDAGPTDWQHQVGTGPYILTNFVSGSGATYTRNKNYWGKTTIGGKQYQLPFIETVVYPIIPDESTQIAALRTGKIDWAPKVKTQYAATLTQSSPDLVQAKYLTGNCDYIKINRYGSATLNKRDVRRALMIGTDLKALVTTVYGGGEWYSWPLAPGVPGYVPLDQLPASQKVLWTYDPTTAKKMIADAGYPNGFKMEIMVSSANTQQVDLANALVAMWTKIGVTATINVADSTAVATAFDGVTYKDCLVQQFTVVNPYTTMNIGRAIGAGNIYGDPKDAVGVAQEKMYQDFSATVDPTQRAAKIATMSLSLMDDCGTIGFTNPNSLNCYWPWFKNYYGELDASYYNTMPMIMRGWIDQDLKTKLGK
jgi:peptide/nickel transport system substrate-binding protein